MASSTTNGSSLYLSLVCLVAALGGFLFGFDTAVISGTVGLVKQDFNLDVLQEGWFVSCALLGCIIGVSFSGKLSDSYGRKLVLILSALLFLVSSVGCMLAGSFTSLIAFRLVGGLGIGVASMISPLYISECAPARLRGMMVSLYQLALTIGIVIAYFTNAYLANHVHDPFASESLKTIFSDDVWRGMLGLGTLPAAIFLVTLFFVPESPRWLLLRGKTQNARAILTRIDGPQAAEAEIKAVNTADENSQTSLSELFTPVYRRALWIGLLLPFLSQVCGINAVIYYGPRILEQTGFTLNSALGGQVTIGPFTNGTTSGRVSPKGRASFGAKRAYFSTRLRCYVAGLTRTDSVRCRPILLRKSVAYVLAARTELGVMPRPILLTSTARQINERQRY